MTRENAPKGKSESPWSLHLGSFRKILFINPPEVKAQIIDLLIYRKKNEDASYSK